MCPQQPGFESGGLRHTTAESSTPLIIGAGDRAEVARTATALH